MINIQIVLYILIINVLKFDTQFLRKIEQMKKKLYH